MKKSEKRVREEEEEAVLADFFVKGLSDMAEKNLKQGIAKIKRQRSNGKSAKKGMKRLLTSMEAEESECEEEEEMMVSSKEERKARGVDTAPAPHELQYVDTERPDIVVDHELGDFAAIFAFACMKALKLDYSADMKDRAKNSGDVRDKEDLELVTRWLAQNIRNPLDRLITSLKGQEDRVSFFTQLMWAAALEFRSPDMTRTHICLLSGQELQPEEVTLVAVVDDPRLFQPLCSTAKQSYNPKPHLFTIHHRYRNITFSVFHLRTLIDSIGVRCISWAKEQGLLHSSSSAIKVVTRFQDSDPKLMRSELQRFKVCKASVEAYTREVV